MENLVNAYGNMLTTRRSEYNESEFVKEKMVSANKLGI
jgi:hypothetical protein